MFTKFYKQAYNRLLEDYNQVRKELEYAKDAIYEKKKYQEQIREIIRLEKELAVAIATKEAFYTCNNTLTEALKINKIQSKL